jgi:hypothetical protein
MLLTLYTVHFRKIHAVSSSGAVALKTDRQTDRKKTGIDTVLLWSKERLP